MTDDTQVQRVLVADDDPAIRQLLVYNLLAAGLAVEAVDDGDAACHAAQTTPPDLIILDVMMPGRDGISALRELKANPATSHVPVVLLTAMATDTDVWEGWEAGADFYITKPFDVDEVLNFVDYLSMAHC